MKDHPSLKSVKITFACWSPTVLGAKDAGPNPPPNSKSDPRQWHSQGYGGSHKKKPPLYSIKTSFVCRLPAVLTKDDGPILSSFQGRSSSASSFHVSLFQPAGSVSSSPTLQIF